tara:strand:- start:146 stop:808 length:663 start_codon:yes stop_codon:yes gene_type:complete
MKNLFNEKSSVFNLDGEMRGKFINELQESDYSNISSIVLEDFKSEDLTDISANFPNINNLYINKADSLINLGGINLLKNLKSLSIKSNTLSDCNNLESLEQLNSLQIEDCMKALNVLKFLPKTLKKINLNANFTLLDGLSKLDSITNIGIIGIDSDLESFPDFPKSIEKLSLRGFPKFKNGVCFKNLNSSVYLNNMLENSIENLPEALSENKWFIHPSKR